MIIGKRLDGYLHIKIIYHKNYCSAKHKSYYATSFIYIKKSCGVSAIGFHARCILFHAGKNPVLC